MDDIDRKLITLLRHDGRRSISDLAADLGLTRATVRARLEKLEQSGEIIGFTVILRSDAIDLPVRGITMIEIAGQAADSVIAALSGFSHIRSSMPSSCGTTSSESMPSAESMMPSVRLKPIAKSSRSCGVPIITAWVPAL